MSLSRKSKVAISTLVILLIIGYLAMNYTYKPHKTLEEREVKFNGEVKDFSQKVSVNVDQWQDMAVVLVGTVTAMDENGFVLEEKVFCQFKEKTEIEKIKKGQTLKIKARMIGYDDLLEEIKLDQTIIIE